MLSKTKWVYRGRPIKDISDIPKCCLFMVYIIHFENDEYYIGSKQIYSVTHPKISKKRANELYSGKGRKPTREEKIKESNWKTYKSSSSIVKEMLKKYKAKFLIYDFYNTKNEMLGREAYKILEAFLNKDEKILNEWVSIKTGRL